MNGRIVAAFDFGTSGLKAALMGPDGRVLASAEEPFDTVTELGGVVEQDPDQWWRAAGSALRGLLRERPGAAPRVISLTGQMQDLILLDRAGHPLRTALLYSDLRAQAEFERLAAELPDWDHLTGNTQDPSSVAAKIAWLAAHEPAVLERTHTLVFGPAAAVAHRAGGEAVCDVVTASTTGLLDARTGRWDPGVCSAAGVPPGAMPRLLAHARAPESVVGVVNETTAAEWGIPAGIPLVVASGDAGSTTDGLVGSEVGDGYLYLGTTGWVARVVETESLEVTGYRYSLLLPGMTSAIAIGAVLSAGSAAQWARATFIPHLSFEEADRAVLERAEATGPEPLLCLPGLGGERAPVRDPDVRGTFLGATPGTTAIDFYRAVLTGVAMNLRHIAGDLGRVTAPIPVVGGAASSPAWRGILADVFDQPIALVSAAEPGLHSATRQAARALGWSEAPEPLVATSTAEVTHPSPRAEHYARTLPLHSELYETLAPTFSALAPL